MADNNDQNQIEPKLDKIMSKIDMVNERITNIQVEAANHRAESVEKFSAMVFEQGRSFDSKLAASERRVDDKMQARAEKVDGWFDLTEKEIADFKTDTATKITSISVKMGIVFSVATVVLGGIVAAVVRFLASIGGSN